MQNRDQGRKVDMKKTYEEIQEKIKRGKAVVLTAEEMTDFVSENGTKKAAKEVDVVTTATFGAMCSSGAFLNLGHANPPTKYQKITLNHVPAYGGIAAADMYIGVTERSEVSDEYGGGHVIEDLIAGENIDFSAHGLSTDCYTGKKVSGQINIKDINNAFLLNPRNAYQNYACATNTSRKTLYTYMGTLLPNMGNISFSSCASLSPLINDPTYRTIGIGTRIFIAGTQGFIVNYGTQHCPSNETNAGTVFTMGDMKKMNSSYLRAATFPGYGISLYIGIGVPIPVLDEEIAKSTAIKDSEIETVVYDYSVKSLKKPVIARFNYAELYKGEVEIKGKKISVGALSSRRKARDIALKLKKMIKAGSFLVSKPAETLRQDTKFHPLKLKK